MHVFSACLAAVQKFNNSQLLPVKYNAHGAIKANTGTSTVKHAMWGYHSAQCVDVVADVRQPAAPASTAVLKGSCSAWSTQSQTLDAKQWRLKNER
jgi:hypothetical protein